MVATAFDTAALNLPPQSIEAEEAVLGGILLSEEAITRVVERLVPEAFYINAHQEIYKAALALYHKEQPSDLMSITTWLYDHKKLEKVGGQSKLAQLVERTISVVNIDRYADLIMDRYLRRQIIHFGNEIVEMGHASYRELPSIFTQIGEKVASLDHPLLAEDEDPDERAYNRLIRDIQELELTISDPGLKTWKLQKLARQYDRTPRQLEEIYFKSLLSQEDESLLTWKELRDRYGENEREWLLHGFLPKGVVVALHAMGGTGKTRLSYDQLYPLIKGDSWNGFSVTGKRRAIIIQTDEPANDMLNALDLRGFDETLDIRYKTRWTFDHLQSLRRDIEQFKPDIVIIDSLTSVNKHSIFSENDVEYARPILLLKDIAQEYGTTFVLIHHSSKTGSARGTSAIFNSVSEVWRLEKDPQAIDPCDRLLTIEKSRSRRPAAYRLRFDPEKGSWSYQGEVGVDENNPDLSIKQQIINFLEARRGIRYEAQEIYEQIGGATFNHVRRCCLQLASDGLISSQRLERKGRANVYFINGIVTDPVQSGSVRISNMISKPKPVIASDTAVTDHLITEKAVFSPQNFTQENQKNDEQMISNAQNVESVSDSVTDRLTDHGEEMISKDDQQGSVTSDNSIGEIPGEKVERWQVGDQVRIKAVPKRYPRTLIDQKGQVVKLSCLGLEIRIKGRGRDLHLDPEQVVKLSKSDADDKRSRNNEDSRLEQ